ncbi:MAG: hypothetical protein ACI920_002393, partial [Saprospiraceae bacterium]
NVLNGFLLAFLFPFLDRIIFFSRSKFILINFLWIQRNI